MAVVWVCEVLVGNAWLHSSQQFGACEGEGGKIMVPAS